MLNPSLSIAVYLLGVLWGAVFILCWVTMRTRHSIGKIAILVASVITVLVLTLPKIEIQLIANQLWYDKYVMARYCTLCFLLISVISGAVCLYYCHCIEPRENLKVKTFGSH